MRRLMRSLELFAGAGGLALGTAMAGFQHAAVIERDRDCCDTLRLNRTLGNLHLKECRIIESDARIVDYSDAGPIDLISGGVPCQPFSLGGKHQAYKDDRDMFPEFARAVAELRPKAFIIENVKGLLRQSFADYFKYNLLRLSRPLVATNQRQSWLEHREELERSKASGEDGGLSYNVSFKLINAADYGVPQSRERVFIVGFRSDLGVDWSFPEPTHSELALKFDQWVSGDYWRRHGVDGLCRPAIVATENVDAVVKMRNDEHPDFHLKPWRTVRDAIDDLPKLRPGEQCPWDRNHFYRLGARSYKGHTGSQLDMPAKTLKAGVNGVPGGENTLRLEHGGVRYFTPRECARLQTFPDDYIISGSWSEQMRQMGNAVPVRLAWIIAKGIADRLDEHERRRREV